MLISFSNRVEMEQITTNSALMVEDMGEIRGLTSIAPTICQTGLQKAVDIVQKTIASSCMRMEQCKIRLSTPNGDLN